MAMLFQSPGRNLLEQLFEVLPTPLRVTLREGTLECAHDRSYLQHAFRFTIYGGDHRVFTVAHSGARRCSPKFCVAWIRASAGPGYTALIYAKK